MYTKNQDDCTTLNLIEINVKMCKMVTLRLLLLSLIEMIVLLTKNEQASPENNKIIEMIKTIAAKPSRQPREAEEL